MSRGFSACSASQPSPRRSMAPRKPQLSTPGLSLTPRRLASPASGSTLMTSAPSHARSWVHEGPASYWVRSTIRMPSSALAIVPVSLSQALRALRLFVRKERRLAPRPGRGQESEEHTSELQSRLHLVCRLLLEKKKKHAYLSYDQKKKKLKLENKN